MLRAELEKTVHLCTRDFKEFNLIMDAVEAYSSASNDGKPIVIRSLPTQDEILAEADKYGFRVPYDGSNNFYDDEAIKHFLAGIKWYRSAIEVGNAV